MPKFSDEEVERIRRDVRISDIIGRYVTWDRRKTNAARGDYWGCCPFHGEKSPSFHCEDAKGRFHCFGCGVSGDVFRFLMDKTGRGFLDVVEELGGRADFQPDPAEAARLKRAAERRQAQAAAKVDRKKKFVREIAYDIWRAAVPIAGTPAELYLRNRGIDFDLDFPTLRYHPEVEYRVFKTGEVLGHFPCLVAAIQAPDDRFLAIQRIYITEAGRKREDVPEAKLSLGSYQDLGGAVRLGKVDGMGNVAEGVETGLGVRGIIGKPEGVLCTIGTSGMRNFIPHRGMTRGLIWPDGDRTKLRRMTARDGAEVERVMPGAGGEAARALLDRMKAEAFPMGLQPTPENGLDYLDIYNRSKGIIAYV